MATRAHECTKRGGSTVCGACGRIAPDWCAEDEPEVLIAIVVQPSGADLEVSKTERAENEAQMVEMVVEEVAAQEKVLQGRRGRKAL